MDNSVRAILENRPRGMALTWARLTEDEDPSAHLLIWDSASYIKTLPIPPKIQMKALNFADDGLPVACIMLWLYGERLFHAFVDMKDVNLKPAIDALSVPDSTLRIAFISGQKVNARIKMTVELSSWIKHVRKIVDKREWLRSEYIEATLKLQRDYFITELWDLGEDISVADPELDWPEYSPPWTIEKKVESLTGSNGSTD
jgi:hypothetical protein